jgi:hypothetical protein
MHLLASPTRFSRTLGAALLTALSLGTGLAYGSPDYPYVAAEHLVMQCTPDCTLCHTVTPGLAGTAKQPFVDSLAASGTWLGEGGDSEGLKRALDHVVSAGTDADQDGVTDIIELLGTGPNIGTSGQLTTNPNVPEGTDTPSPDICPPEPKYGCGAAHVTPRAHVHTDYVIWASLGGLLAFGLWRRFSSRRSG